MGAETNLDILRRNVVKMPSVVSPSNWANVQQWTEGLNIPSVAQGFDGDTRWTAGQRVQLDGLVKMAVNHIDQLKSRKDDAGNPLVDLPFYGEVFGTAWIGRVQPGAVIVYDENGAIVKRDRKGGTQLLLPQMNSGVPVAFYSTVATAAFQCSLTLFTNGYCFPSNGAIEAVEALKYAQYI